MSIYRNRALRVKLHLCGAAIYTAQFTRANRKRLECQIASLRRRNLYRRRNSSGSWMRLSCQIASLRRRNLYMDPPYGIDYIEDWDSVKLHLCGAAIYTCPAFYFDVNHASVSNCISAAPQFIRGGRTDDSSRPSHVSNCISAAPQFIPDASNPLIGPDDIKCQIASLRRRNLYGRRSGGLYELKASDVSNCISAAPQFILIFEVAFQLIGGILVSNCISAAPQFIQERAFLRSGLRQFGCQIASLRRRNLYLFRRPFAERQ